MANAEKINCQRRDIKTKGYLNELKHKGFIPGTVYGKGIDNQTIAFDLRQLTRVFQNHGVRGLFSLEIQGSNSIMAVVREMQRHPVSGQLIHVDFWKVNMNEKINTVVSVYITGEEEVIKKGGILQVGTKEIEISCLPQDIPDSITCDVAVLDIGDKITVGDLTLPPEVELVSDPDSLIVTILAPSREVVEELQAEEGETNQEVTAEGE
ncbi:MAG: 50S ribosomal protein L25 [Syntrophomonadaceae bacterium]|jgi:large subunit ribosomal protein L25